MTGEGEATAGFPGVIEVREVIRRALDPAPGLTGETAALILERGGKMLRPRLLLSCAALAGGGGAGRGRALLEAAAAVEMIHTASLVHDDIIDEAACRRGKETLHLRWGPRRSALAGDLLLARAFALLSRREGSRSLLKLLTRTVALLCQGEIFQMNLQHCWGITERQYYLINYLKTAQFIAACCEAGGRIAGAAPARLRALRRFGLRLGQAFQIIDDILDYTGEQDQLGKPAGNDLEQGRATLPLIHLLETEKHYLKMLLLLPPGSAPPPEVQAMLRRGVMEKGSLDYAMSAARRKGAEAISALQQFPASPERRPLTELARALTASLRVQGPPVSISPG